MPPKRYLALTARGAILTFPHSREAEICPAVRYESSKRRPEATAHPTTYAGFLLYSKVMLIDMAPDKSGMGASTEPQAGAYYDNLRCNLRLTGPTPAQSSARPSPAANCSLYSISGTFDSNFLVLFNFRSRYLFAIGLAVIFSFMRNLPHI